MTAPHAIAENRKARRVYEVEETIEAGLLLQGSEVKSLRAHRADIEQSYAAMRDDGMYLLNAHIAPYDPAGMMGHAPKRARKLLLHKRQIAKLSAAATKDGMTLVPLRLYFSERGRVKIALAIARGKRLHDRRETDKKRSWQRQKERLLRRDVKS